METTIYIYIHLYTPLSTSDLSCARLFFRAVHGDPGQVSGVEPRRHSPCHSAEDVLAVLVELAMQGLSLLQLCRPAWHPSLRSGLACVL